jgi:hypothetical protein
MLIETSLQLELVREIERFIQNGNGHVDIVCLRNGGGNWLRLEVKPIEQVYFRNEDLYKNISNEQ